jgi:hypothetical protein
MCCRHFRGHSRSLSPCVQANRPFLSGSSWCDEACFEAASFGRAEYVWLVGTCKQLVWVEKLETSDLRIRSLARCDLVI